MYFIACSPLNTDKSIYLFTHEAYSKTLWQICVTTITTCYVALLKYLRVWLCCLCLKFKATSKNYHRMQSCTNSNFWHPTLWDTLILFLLWVQIVRYKYILSSIKNYTYSVDRESENIRQSYTSMLKFSGIFWLNFSEWSIISHEYKKEPFVLYICTIIYDRIEIFIPL